MKFTSFGKLSSNGPRIPAGYQMKWPIPREAKFSPSFHEVSPATVPLHSFCQIFFPIRSDSTLESVMAKRGVRESHKYAPQTDLRRYRLIKKRCRRLDVDRLSTSMQTSAAAKPNSA